MTNDEILQAAKDIKMKVLAENLTVKTKYADEQGCSVRAAEPNQNWCVGCSPDNCSGCGTFYEIKKQRDELLAENEQLRKDAERYRVLRDSEYQLNEDDPSVSDSFFNQYFGEKLDAAVDELKSRFDSASVKGEQ